MRLILGCLLVLIATSLAAGQLVSAAQTPLVVAFERAIAPAAQGSVQTIEQAPIDIAVSAKPTDVAPVTLELPRSPAVALAAPDSGSSESRQPNVEGRDLADARLRERAGGRAGSIAVPLPKRRPADAQESPVSVSDAHQVSGIRRAHVASARRQNRVASSRRQIRVASSRRRVCRHLGCRGHSIVGVGY
jgi:hypothetical protein